MSNIIIASNRSPVDFRRGAEQTISLGGLVQAMSRCLNPQDLWVAVSQGNDDANRVDQESIVDFADQAGTHLRMKKIFLDEEVYSRYYSRFSNSFLWPLFHLTRGPYHEMSEVFPPPKFEGNDFFSYSLVNDIFAKAIVSHAEDDSVVWVQDYHLLLLPERIKERREDLTVGQFLHIPMFHPVTVDRYLRTEQRARQGLEYLIKGMLANDLLGFHIPEYIENFAATVKQFFPLSSITDTEQGIKVSYAGRTCYVEPFPIGVDVAFVQEAAPGASLASTEGGRIQALLDAAKENGRFIIAGLERADYTKGLIERFAILERMLQEGMRLQYIGIAAPSREGVEAYTQLSEMIDQYAKRINAQWAGQLQYQPVHISQIQLHPPENFAFLRQADCVFITTIEDGMNLVFGEAILAKASLEYQQRGFVVVGNCGAEKVAHEYGDQHGLVRIDPFDPRDAVVRIKRAIDSRYPVSNALIEHVKSCDTNDWREGYLRRLTELKVQAQP